MKIGQIQRTVKEYAFPNSKTVYPLISLKDKINSILEITCAPSTETDRYQATKTTRIYFVKYPKM